MNQPYIPTTPDPRMVAQCTPPQTEHKVRLSMQVTREQARQYMDAQQNRSEADQAVYYAVQRFTELTGRAPTVLDVNLFVEGDNLVSVDVKMEARF